MPVPAGKTSYHHGDLRAALLAAGEAMLERVGPEALSLRELTREIGVSNNAPRRHFPNKQALLDALAISGFERLGAALERAVADAHPDFERRILRLSKVNIRFSIKHSSLLRLMFAAKQRDGAPPALLEASYQALLPGPRTIEYGQRVGAVRAGDPERLALAIFASVEGLISLSSNGKFMGVPIEKLAAEIIPLIMAGLTPRPTAKRG